VLLNALEFLAPIFRKAGGIAVGYVFETRDPRVRLLSEERVNEARVKSGSECKSGKVVFRQYVAGNSRGYRPESDLTGRFLAASLQTAERSKRWSAL
jgi:hypothetical protein